MRIRAGQITLLTIVPFVGAGWSWPWCNYGKWHFGIYFHCNRGLFLGVGWNDTERRIGRRVRELSAEDRGKLIEALKPTDGDGA